MRASAFPRTIKLLFALLALLVASCCAAARPAMAGEGVLGSSLGGEAADEGSSLVSSALADGALHVSADVALVAAAGGGAVEPVVGSFTVDGLTYAIVGEGQVALVAVSPRTLAGGLAGGSAAGLASASDAGPSSAPSGEDSGVPPRSEAEQVPSGATSPSPSPEGASSDGIGDEDASELVALEVPGSVEYDGVTCSVVSIGPRAFAGCDADVVAIPATVESVDDLAFRGSAVKAIEVADGNPTYSSYDGMLFDADMTSLLLIPEGKQGAARIPKTASSVPPDALSHCASVTSVEVEAGSAAYYSENGSLYDMTDKALLWAPDVENSSNPEAPQAKLGEMEGFVAGDSTLTIALNGGMLTYYSYTQTEPEPTGERGPFYVTREPGKFFTLPMTFLCSLNRVPTGDNSYQPVEVGVGNDWYSASYKLLPPTKEGFVFAGWDLEGGVQWINPEQQHPDDKLSWDVHITGDATLTALWAQEPLTLSWDPGGGWWPDGAEGRPGEIKKVETHWTPRDKVVPPTSPDAETWEFDCWTTVKNSSNEKHELKKDAGLPLTDTTYYARYKLREYHISYDLAGGSLPPGTTNPDTYDNETATFTFANPTKDGYVFAGWTGTGIKEGTKSYSVTVPRGSSGDRAYIATWAQEQVTVSWHPNEGAWAGKKKNEPEEISYNWSYGGKIWLPKDVPEHPGYRFAYWTIGKDTFDQVVEGRTNLPESDAIYYARWSKITYSVTYDLDGGELEDGANPTEYTVTTPSFTLANPRKRGCVFLGWALKSAEGWGDAVETVVIETGSTGYRQYKAMWGPILAVDVPIEVTVRIDPFSPESQEEGLGYLVSRSACALDVACIGFEPEEDVTDRLGNNATDMFLEVLPDGVEAAEVRFRLDRPASESDADRLASFGLPNGYESRLGVAYRLDVSGAAIDAFAGWDGVAAAGRVSYTVKASSGA